MKKLSLSTLVILAMIWLAVPISQARELAFEERVPAQGAIEWVYYSYQIGATKPDTTASFGHRSRKGG